jgi:hypothetical protein
MFTVRQIIHTHRPFSNGACAGCYDNITWTPEHVIEVLEANGHDPLKHELSPAIPDEIAWYCIPGDIESRPVQIIFETLEPPVQVSPVPKATYLSPFQSQYSVIQRFWPISKMLGVHRQ